MKSANGINLSMLCDFYELTMGNGYFVGGYQDKICYFDIFYRNVPDNGGFAIAAGLEQVVDYILNLRFGEADIEYLRGRKLFDEGFLDIDSEDVRAYPSLDYLSMVFARPLARIFVGYDKALCDLTVRAFIINAFSLLFVGIAIFSSSFFTALSDGVTSALIAFLRTLVFQVAAVLLLPLIFGVDGIWASVIAAELAACVLGVIFIFAKRKKFGY